MRSSKQNADKRIKMHFDTTALVLLIVMMLVGVAFLLMMAVVDAFPKEIVMILLVVLVVMIVLAAFLMTNSNRKVRTTGIVIVAIFSLLYGMGVYYLASTYSMFARITTGSGADAKSVNVTSEPFNVYITGIDQWTVEKGQDLERSDVNMIATICPNSRQILLTSIPRDAYVPLHRTGTMDKLTHTGIYGVDETLNTIKDWTGLEMNYYVKVNFSACVHIVDAMGGVDVNSPVAFSSSISKYKYKEGWNHLNGHEALYFARERHAFEKSDQDRVQNQQRVIKAMLNKMMTSSTLLTSYGKLMDAISEDMETNMPQDDIRALVKMQMRDLSGWDIKMQHMEGDYASETVASLSSKHKYTVLKIQEDSFNKCIKKINKIMHPDEKDIEKATETRQKNSMATFVKRKK